MERKAMGRSHRTGKWIGPGPAPPTRVISSQITAMTPMRASTIYANFCTGGGNSCPTTQ